MSSVIDEGIKDIRRWGDSCSINKDELLEVIKHTLKIIDKNMADLGEGYLSEASTGNVYTKAQNVGWTPGFWTGMLSLAYELTHDEKYLNLIKKHAISYKNRMIEKIDIDTHDLGFVYTLSCVALHKLTNDEEAKDTAIMAAKQLATRYFDKAKIIQAWGDLNDPKNRGRMIIDCLMNLPLLYWAYEITGETVFKDIAHNHAKQAEKYIVRQDASTYHTYFMDVDTGEPKYGQTAQGYSDNSCWSRGQAWGIYGFALSYSYTQDEELLNTSKKLAHYFLNRLPEDYVAYWDLIFTSGEQERDSSAASVAVCGLFQLADILKQDGEIYKNAGIKILKSLCENYSTKEHPNSNGLLLHAVYAKPMNRGIDECCTWGDYFYLEALVRLYMKWNMYW